VERLEGVHVKVAGSNCACLKFNTRRFN
jgi:hypothetical protein